MFPHMAENENNQEDELGSDGQPQDANRPKNEINIADDEEQQNVAQALFNNTHNIYMPAWTHQDMSAGTIVLPSIATIQSGNYMPEQIAYLHQQMNQMPTLPQMPQLITENAMD